jgi:hypothetical protein
MAGALEIYKCSDCGQLVVIFENGRRENCYNHDARKWLPDYFLYPEFYQQKSLCRFCFIASKGIVKTG